MVVEPKCSTGELLARTGVAEKIASSGLRRKLLSVNLLCSKRKEKGSKSEKLLPTVAEKVGDSTAWLVQIEEVGIVFVLCLFGLNNLSYRLLLEDDDERRKE